MHRSVDRNKAVIETLISTTEKLLCVQDTLIHANGT